MLGAWWSYEVLGWGGYWAWDPVENASFLPWLTGTAYLHSVMVQERRGMLRVWNLSLLCATFCAHDPRHVPHPLAACSTRCTRSPSRRIGAVPARRSSRSSSPSRSGSSAGAATGCARPGRIDSPLSREGAFLANNVLFAAFAFVVLLGTVFPLIVEALQRRPALGRRARTSTA